MSQPELRKLSPVVGLDQSPGVTFTVILALSLGLLWSHSFPLIHSWLEQANPPEQCQKAGTTWQTPGAIPSHQGKSTNPYHTISRESHSCGVTFVTHGNAHEKLHSKTELCVLFHTTPNNPAFLSNGSDNCTAPGGCCPPLKAAPNSLHTAASKPWTLWSIKSTFYPFWDASASMRKQFN